MGHDATAITIYKPYVTKNGEPYSYFDYLCSIKSDVVIEIENESSKSENASGKNLATVSNKELSNKTLSRQISNVKKDIRGVLDKVSPNHAEQIKQKRSLKELGRLLTVLPQVCEGTVEVECLPDRYGDTYRADSRLKNMRILVGAYTDSNDILFVKIGSKEFHEGFGRKNKLYLSITIDAINKEEVGIVPWGNEIIHNTHRNQGTPTSTYKLTDVLPRVKDNNGSIVKYFPDQRLTESQLEVKRKP